MWEDFRIRQRFDFEIRSYQELASDAQVGDPPPPGEPDRRVARLALPAADYRLVVVDEAHAFRSPDTQYYRALRRLMAAGGVVRDLVLLTATPVNNSLWDLYHQIMLFARHDAAFLRLGIPYLRDFFKQALAADLQEAAPRHLFLLLNDISVRRTRHHIQRYYPGEMLQTPEGPREIRFPKPRLLPVGYSFEELLPGFFAEVANAVEHDLTMARYRPDAYRTDGQGAPASEEVLAGLLRSQLLKRFESSVHAFARTLEHLIPSHEAFLALLERGAVPRPGLDPEDLGDELDDEGLLARLQEGDEIESAERFDLPRLRADVEADRDCLRHLLERTAQVSPERDPKLQALWRVVEECGRQQGDARKVIVFSYFADTVAYIAQHVASAPGAAAYWGRIAACAGSPATKEVAELYREPGAAVAGFAPRSSGLPEGSPDQFDLLLATDVLAEGQNLQQAARVVNFDLPWNPMRLALRWAWSRRVYRAHRLWPGNSAPRGVVSSRWLPATTGSSTSWRKRWTPSPARRSETSCAVPSWKIGCAASRPCPGGPARASAGNRRRASSSRPASASSRIGASSRGLRSRQSKATSLPAWTASAAGRASRAISPRPYGGASSTCGSALEIPSSPITSGCSTLPSGPRRCPRPSGTPSPFCAAWTSPGPQTRQRP